MGQNSIRRIIALIDERGNTGFSMQNCKQQNIWFAANLRS
jgi:hypothetical protein